MCLYAYTVPLTLNTIDEIIRHRMMCVCLFVKCELSIDFLWVLHIRNAQNVDDSAQKEGGRHKL